MPAASSNADSEADADLNVWLDTVDWGALVGRQRTTPPLSFCGRGTLSVAIPSPLKQMRRIPLNATEKVLSEGSLYTWRPSEDGSGWLDQGEDCVTSFATRFFTKKKRKDMAAAFIGRASLEACGTQKWTIGGFTYFSNVFRPYADSPGVSVTCACTIDSKGDLCVPSVRSVDLIAARRELDEGEVSGKAADDLEGPGLRGPQRMGRLTRRDREKRARKSKVSGELLNRRHIAGIDNDVNIFHSSRRMLYKFDYQDATPANAAFSKAPASEEEDAQFVGEGYLWPASCSAASMADEYTEPLIARGCPVNADIDLRVHSETEPKTPRRTLIVSTKPVVLVKDGKDVPMIMRCNLELLSIPGSEFLKGCPDTHSNDDLSTAADSIAAYQADSLYNRDFSVTEKGTMLESKPSPISILDVKPPSQSPGQTRSADEGRTQSDRRQHQRRRRPDNALRRLAARSDTAFGGGSSSGGRGFGASTMEGGKGMEVGGGSSMMRPDTSNLSSRDSKLQKYNENERIEVRSRLEALARGISDGDFDSSSLARSYATKPTINRAEGDTGAFSTPKMYEAEKRRIEEAVRKIEQLGTNVNGYPGGAAVLFPQVFNQYVAGPWMTQWGANALTRSADVQVAHPDGYGYGGLSREGRSGVFGTGARGNNYQVAFDEIARAVSSGFARKGYGVNVDRSMFERATATEVSARSTDVVSVLDFLDRSFGQRVSVRNFGISVRHDLDDILFAADRHFGTEVYTQYKSISVAVGTDVLDTRYFISIGMLGVNVAVARDFNSYGNNLQINWGRGWQFFYESDFPDDFSESLGQAVGFGRPSRMYLSVGAGVSDSGLPLAAVNLQAPLSRVGVGLLNRGADRLMQYSVTAGRFTYLWESILAPDTLVLPTLVT